MEGGLLCPLISGVYFSYCCGGDATLSTVEGNYSARLFRWRTLSTGVRRTLLCLLWRGTTLPAYFGGVLCLLGCGGRPYSVYGVRGGLLCPTISMAYSAYWGGEATLSMGVRGPTLPTGVGVATLSRG